MKRARTLSPIGLLGVLLAGCSGDPQDLAQDAAQPLPDAAFSDDAAMQDGGPARDAASPALPDGAAHDATPPDDDRDADTMTDAAEGHCAPGDFVSMYDFPRGTGGLNRTDDCYDSDYTAAGAAGLFAQPPEVPLKVSSVQLATPMTADQPYAGSLFLSYRGPVGAMRLQIYGTRARCGAGSTAELLLDRPVAQESHVECFELAPSAAYGHWLVVLRDSDDLWNDEVTLAAIGEATICAQGSCP